MGHTYISAPFREHIFCLCSYPPAKSSVSYHQCSWSFWPSVVWFSSLFIKSRNYFQNVLLTIRKPTLCATSLINHCCTATCRHRRTALTSCKDRHLYFSKAIKIWMQLILLFFISTELVLKQKLQFLSIYILNDMPSITIYFLHW